MRFVTHEVFAKQPVRGTDAYPFRVCFHTWSNRYTMLILLALVPVMKLGARIVLNDIIVPEPRDLFGQATSAC